MTIQPATPSSAPTRNGMFSTLTPNFQLAWDSTSLGELKTCPARYKYSIIDQWSPRSKSHHLVFGGLYASGVELYAHARAKGLDHDAAIVLMLRRTLETSGTRGEDGAWTPWDSGDPLKNLPTLIRSLIWNCDDRRDSLFLPVTLASGKPAVELSFTFSAFDLDGESILFCGHMDSIVSLQGERWVLDDKTTTGALTANYFKQWTPNNQMSLYALAGRAVFAEPVKGVLVRAAQIGVNFTRFATRQAPRPQAVLAEWLEDTKAWVRLAKGYAEAGHWPLNDKACGNFGGCPFIPVCSVSPSHREAWLRDGFEKREWNPLRPRGEDVL